MCLSTRRGWTCASMRRVRRSARLCSACVACLVRRHPSAAVSAARGQRHAARAGAGRAGHRGVRFFRVVVERSMRLVDISSFSYIVHSGAGTLLLSAGPVPRRRKAVLLRAARAADHLHHAAAGQGRTSALPPRCDGRQIYVRLDQPQNAIRCYTDGLALFPNETLLMAGLHRRAGTEW